MVEDVPEELDLEGVSDIDYDKMAEAYRNTSIDAANMAGVPKSPGVVKVNQPRPRLSDDQKEWELEYYPDDERGKQTDTFTGHAIDVVARPEGASTVTIYDSDGHAKVHKLGVREVRRVD